MSKTDRLRQLREEIRAVDPAEAARLLAAGGAVLVDVREADEIAQGSPPGAARLGRGFLELKIEEVAPAKDAPVLCLCAGGTRSLFAADSLRRLGYTDARSVAGGMNAWKDAGLPVEMPRAFDAAARARYSRHLRIPEVGEEGQRKLLDSRVLLVGAGGLGCPAAFYLAAAGVGTLRVVDHDVVDRSNLQRQILHQDSGVGTPKVESAAARLRALNPDVRVEGHRARLDSSNIDELIAGCDLVVDGSDNFATRYLVNDACVKHRVPNVHGSVYRFEGQVSVFHPAGGGPCYRCLYPEPPPPGSAPSCAEAGVLGVLPGVIGVLEAVEAVKLLLGIGEPLVGRMLHYDALSQRVMNLKVKARADCAVCAPGVEFPGYVDYGEFCGG